MKLHCRNQRQKAGRLSWMIVFKLLCKENKENARSDSLFDFKIGGRNEHKELGGFVGGVPGDASSARWTTR